MGMITKIAACAITPAIMATAPAAAQNIISPPPGTDLTIFGILKNNTPIGVGPGAGGPSNPGCGFTLQGKVISASPGVIRVDNVISCKVFTVPIFFRFDSPTTGTIDRIEATKLAMAFPNLKCGASNVFFTWTNMNDLRVPATDGEVPPGIPACNFEIQFIVTPDVYVL